jgi:hypothetical protein
MAYQEMSGLWTTKDDIGKAWKLSCIKKKIIWGTLCPVLSLPLGRKGYLSDFLDDTEFTNIFRGVSQDNGPLVTSVAMALGNQADVITN